MSSFIIRAGGRAGGGRRSDPRARRGGREEGHIHIAYIYIYICI